MASLSNAPQNSPYSLGANADFQLDPETVKALAELPPEMQEVAKRGLEAIQSGKVPAAAHPTLASEGQKILAARLKAAQQGGDQGSDQAEAAPEVPSFPGSPYGVPGGKVGPETREQAVNEQLQAAAQKKSATNLSITNAQQSGSSYDMPAQHAVGAMSGLSNHQKIVSDLFDKSSDTRPQGMTPEEWNAQTSMISGTPIVDQAQKGLKTQEDMLNMQLGAKRNPLETANLGPLMALQDHFLGSNMAGAYTPPETASVQQKRIFDALQKVQSDRLGLAGNVIAGVKASKGGLVGDVVTGGQKIEASQGAVDPMGSTGAARADRNARTLMGAAHADMKELNAANAATQEAQRMLASGGSILDTTFRDKFLKAMIGGRVTNYDLMRQSGDTALADRAEQVMNSMANGSFTPKNRAEYQDALRIIQEANQHEAAARMADLRKVGIGGLGMDPDRTDAVLSIGHLANFAPVSTGTLDSSKKKSAAAVPGLYDGSYKLAHPTPEQKQARLEYLKNKAGQ